MRRRSGFNWNQQADHRLIILVTPCPHVFEEVFNAYKEQNTEEIEIGHNLYETDKLFSENNIFNFFFFLKPKTFAF